MHVQHCFKKKYLPVIGRVWSDPPPCINVTLNWCKVIKVLITLSQSKITITKSIYQKNTLKYLFTSKNVFP